MLHLMLHTFSLSLLYLLRYVLFSMLFDGVWLSRRKGLLIYLLKNYRMHHEHTEKNLEWQLTFITFSALRLQSSVRHKHQYDFKRTAMCTSASESVTFKHLGFSRNVDQILMFLQHKQLRIHTSQSGWVQGTWKQPSQVDILTQRFRTQAGRDWSQWCWDSWARSPWTTAARLSDAIRTVAIPRERWTTSSMFQLAVRCPPCSSWWSVVGRTIC